MLKSERMQAVRAVICGLTLGLAACGGSGQDARLKVRFPELSESSAPHTQSESRSALSVSVTQPGCPAEMRLYAESVRSGDRVENLLTGVNLHWLRFFDSALAFDHSSAPLFYSTDSTAALNGQELEVASGRAWTLKADGGVTLKCLAGGGCVGSFNAPSMLTAPSPFALAGGSTSPSFVAEDWECPENGTLLWDEVTVSLDQTSGSDLQVVVVPFKGMSSSSLRPAAGESMEVDLDVTAARVPFGAYSFASMVGQSSSVPLGSFDGVTTNSSGEPTALVRDELVAPFYDLVLTGLKARLFVTAASRSDITLIPVLRGTSLWRGITEGSFSNFILGSGDNEVFSAHFYPIPQDQLDWVGLILKCNGATGCGSVTINDGADQQVGPTLWDRGSLLCLIKEDINLANPSDEGVTRPDASESHKVLGALVDPSWKWYSSSFSTVTSLAPPTCLEFMAR